MIISSFLYNYLPAPQYLQHITLNKFQIGGPTKEIIFSFNDILLVNDNDGHRRMIMFLLTAPKILILGSENRA